MKETEATFRAPDSLGVPAERLEEAIRQAGLTPAETARRMGVSRQRLDQWLKEKSIIPNRELHLLALTTRKPVSWFFGERAITDDDAAALELGKRVREVLKGQVGRNLLEDLLAESEMNGCATDGVLVGAG